MSEWQPIETAPKDGTPVLLWPGHEVWTGATKPSTGWFVNFGPYWVGHMGILEPTHWMPLPHRPEPGDA